jgi:putative hydrolase of the HAD superfamily
MKIRNILFDFGGVLYDIDFLRCTKELAKLSSQPDIFRNLTLDGFIDSAADFEKGVISPQQFRELFRTNYFISADNKDFDKAWNSMLIGLKDESIHLLKQLSKKFRISLLSNSNQIHYNYFNNDCKLMFDCFESLFFSFQLGLKKPDKKIFDFVCQKMNYIPQQTLFVDDSISNIESAILAGLKTFHFSSETTMSGLLHSIEKFTHI